MLVGRCSTCKNWVNENYWFLQGYGDTHKMYKMCIVATKDDSEGYMDAICAGEGIGGELITREDFGCVLYNAR